MLWLKTLLGPANESFFFQNLAVLQIVLFFPRNIILLPTQSYFVETSRFICCLWYLNVWVELSAVSWHIVALWKRILKRVFLACGQLLKATYIERNWPPFLHGLAKNKYCVWRNQQHNHRRPFKSHSKKNARTTMRKRRYSTFKIKEHNSYSSKEKKFPTFFFLLQTLFFVSNAEWQTLLWTRFNFYASSVFLCEKSQPE